MLFLHRIVVAGILLVIGLPIYAAEGRKKTQDHRIEDVSTKRKRSIRKKRRNRRKVGATMVREAKQSPKMDADAQILIGRQWYHTKNEDGEHGFQANQVVASLHGGIDMGGWSIVAGPAVSFSKFNEKDFASSDRVEHAELGPQLAISATILNIEPFLKGRYTAWSHGEIEAENSEYEAKLEYELQGASASIGSKLNITPAFGLIAEVQYGFHMLEFKRASYKDKETGEKIDSKAKSNETDFNSEALLVGAAANF